MCGMKVLVSSVDDTFRFRMTYQQEVVKAGEESLMGVLVSFRCTSGSLAGIQKIALRLKARMSHFVFGHLQSRDIESRMHTSRAENNYLFPETLEKVLKSIEFDECESFKFT